MQRKEGKEGATLNVLFSGLYLSLWRGTGKQILRNTAHEQQEVSEEFKENEPVA
jgi:hypothetical protein